ncbi:50S ribosomal protein L11 methyltransferase [Kaistia dalseonensis]|uniref:Ribosomal protein L11 methyltransferase n=1 Tax=Kaistia dalseonensis TaxID=410840 RepID=A0ABU0HBR2_9HYPH|nr:50S ribosomal protein L11 methyltransferase [Kaistia dalseonensis]MCX5497119.1 50S ribosomal protein L11 methyltransferase [Kaistia dalseonensis]MDQ0439745.1 ribosomal protein L11 methyltransferase [Kaistia dalseonensis]
MTLIASLHLAKETDAQALVEAIGASEALDFPTAATTEQDDKSWVVDIYFEAQPDEALLASIVRDVLGEEAGTFVVAPLPDEDWVAKSLEGLKPVRAGRFLVHGSHDRDKIQPGDIAIEIEAGEAFGTGHHGTTAGCLAEIDRLGALYDYKSILDLGTGTGVLAIAIAMAWHKPVLATDIDPIATRVTAENAALNGVATLIEAATAEGFGNPVFAAHAPFDLIIANILAGPLIALAPEVVRHLAPEKGTIVLSGLLVAQGPSVTAAYEAEGMKLARQGEMEGWLTLTLERAS